LFIIWYINIVSVELELSLSRYWRHQPVQHSIH